MAAAATQAPTPTSRFYRHELDVLRFGAFGLVFLAHGLPFPDNLPAGAAKLCAGLREGFSYGVDVFFLLSSYLITELLLREYRQKNTINIRAFWIRRILRIWPLYFAFLAITIWLVPLILPESFPRLHRIAYATFWGNFALMINAKVDFVAGILWSVSIEEQFYLLWPLVMYGCIRRLKAIAVMLLVAAWGMRVVLVLGGATSLWPYWGNTVARMDPIAAGALVALLLNGRLPKLANAMRVTMLMAGMLLLVACGMFLPKTGPPALVAYPLATLAALLLLLGFLGAPWSYPRGLEYLGRISYGLYVFHILALRLAHTYVRAEFPVAVLFSLRFLTALLLTLAMAAISFRWLEMPFLRLKDRFAIIQSH